MKDMKPGQPLPPGHPPIFKPAPDITHNVRDWVVDPAQVNAEEHWSIHMAFKQIAPLSETEATALHALVDAAAHMDAKPNHAVGEQAIGIRGWYDVAGYRVDADLLCWVLADTPEACQAAYREIVSFTNTAGEVVFEAVWSAMSRHMPAEFNNVHLAACFGGFAPRKYVAVYPFVRSYDWYYMHEARRAAILREHGLNGREFNDVPVSTLAAFALNDWEWIISLEADSLDRVMAVLRRQRDAEARLYVRVDTPFYTGVRMELKSWAALRK